MEKIEFVLDEGLRESAYVLMLGYYIRCVDDDLDFKKTALENFKKIETVFAGFMDVEELKEKRAFTIRLIKGITPGMMDLVYDFLDN